MEHVLRENKVILILPPERPRDFLGVTIAVNGVTTAALVLDANQTAALISDLRAAFAQFAE